MKRNFLIFLLLILCTTLYSNDNVLIITSDQETYNTYNELLKSKQDLILYDVEIIQVDDNTIEGNFNGSKEYLTNRWANPPLFSYYIDGTSKKSGMIYGFNKRSQPNMEIIQILLPKLFLESRVAKEFPLYLTNIIPEKEIITLYREYGYSPILIEGSIQEETIIETLYENINREKNLSHYYILYLFGNAYYLGEKILLIINGSFVFMIILLLNIYSKKLKFHLKHNRSYIQTIPLKVISIFIFYFVATLTLEFVDKISGHTGILTKYPGTFFLIKNLILFFIYHICFQVIKDSSISKSPYFYANTSLYSSIAIFFILAMFYMPLALYQIWPITMTLLFIITTNRKRVYMLLSPLIVIILLYDFIISESSAFSILMLNSRYTGNVFLTLFTTPYIFLQESYFRFTHRKQKKITYTKDIILSLLTLTITFTTVAILLELN